MEEHDKRKVTPSPKFMQCIQELRVMLAAILTLQNWIISAAINHESAKYIREEEEPIDGTLGSVLGPMLQAVGSSASTLISLSDAPGMHTRDCHSIARSVIEGCVNGCYIIAEGVPAAERALRHVRQKSFRDLHRELQIGNSCIKMYTGTPDPKLVRQLERDINEFTTKSGREKNWVDLSLDDRIRVAGEKLGGSVLASLRIAQFAVYRHSSEILHGTLFGSCYFWGMTFPRKGNLSLKEWAEIVGHQHILILFSCVVAICAVIEAFHRAYGFANAFEESKKLVGRMKDIPYFKKE